MEYLNRNHKKYYFVIYKKNSQKIKVPTMVSPISLEPIFGLKIQLRPATHDRANANLRTKKNSYSNFDVITKYVGLQMC